MSLTVDLKPSGFRPVGSPLVYQWTESDLSGKTNYRVQLQFDGYTSDLPIFEFRPNSGLVIEADIAPILRSLLALGEVVADRWLTTFVKYQAVWNEGSDSQVDLSGDIIRAYVGNNHFLNSRTKFNIDSADVSPDPLDPKLSTGVFLNRRFITAFVGRTTMFEFLHDNSLPEVTTLYVFENDMSATTHDFAGDEFAFESFEHVFVTPGLTYAFVGQSAEIGYNYYAYIQILVLEECDNPIHLRWINDFGGLYQFSFDYNQIFGFQIGEDERAQVLELVRNGVSPFSEWLNLNELQRQGVVYNDNYKTGQFAQDYTDEDNPIPVVVLPDEQATQTKRVSHDFRVRIRYPLIPNTDI